MTIQTRNKHNSHEGGSKINVVFSCLYGESEEFLEILIFNFMAHTDESAMLVINVPEKLNHKDESEFPGARLLIKKHGAQRAAWGHTLLGGHIENLRLAEERIGPFSYFVAMASNSLFVRPFDLNAALKSAGRNSGVMPGAGLLIEEMGDDWHWPGLRNTTSLTKRLSDRWNIERYSQNQIEGLFASRIDWQVLGKVFDDIKDHCDGLTAPLEEILPSTIWNNLGSGGYARICYMYWDRFNQGRLRDATVDDVLNSDRLPQQVVMLKWFNRSKAFPEARAVGTPVGLELIRAIKSVESLQDHIGLSAMIGGFARELYNREERFSLFNPLSPARVSRTDLADMSRPTSRTMHRSVEIECVAKRQTISIDHGFIANAVDGHLPYIYMEGSGLGAVIRLVLTKSDRSIDRLRIDCIGDVPSAVLERCLPSLLAYLYIPLPLALSARNTFLSLQAFTAPSQYSHMLAQSLVLSDGDYLPIVATQITAIPGGVTASYVANTHSSMPFIGVPIYANSATEIELDFVKYHGTS